MGLIVGLTEASAIGLRSAVLIEGLLLAVLRVVALLVVLLLIGSRMAASAVGLAWLESLGVRLERGGSGTKRPLRLGGVGGIVDMELSLRLPGQVLVLGSRIVLPRVEVGHGTGWGGARLRAEVLGESKVAWA